MSEGLSETIFMWIVGGVVTIIGVALSVVWGEVGKVRSKLHDLSGFVHILRANFDDWMERVKKK